MFERGESTAQRVLCPALRIRLLGIFQKTVESGEDCRNQIDKLELADEIGRLRNYEIVPVAKSLP